MRTRCIAVPSIGKVELRETNIPEPAEGEVIVEALYTGISPGTEIRCLTGRSEQTVFPYLAGYAHVGRIFKRGPGTKLPEGTVVFVGGTQQAEGLNMKWGGHTQYALTKESRCLVVPENVDPLDAAMAKLAGIAHHGLRLSRPFPGERVALIGLGIIGQLGARLHAMTGARVFAADLSPARAEQVRVDGITPLVVKGTLAETFAGVLPDGADIIVDATGVPAVAAQALLLAKEVPWNVDFPPPGARYLMLGSYEADFTIPYHTAFMKALSFLIPRDGPIGDIAACLQLIAQGKLKVRDLISDVRPPEAAAQTYQDLQQRNTPLLTVIFKWK